jgi:hypothetical protein
VLEVDIPAAAVEHRDQLAVGSFLEVEGMIDLDNPVSAAVDTAEFHNQEELHWRMAMVAFLQDTALVERHWDMATDIAVRLDFD